MSDQPALFADLARYCIDTNVVVSFLRDSDDEHYGADLFAPQWRIVEASVRAGVTIAPRQVDKELEKWAEKSERIRTWLNNHRYMFSDVTSGMLATAKQVVNAYPAYSSSTNYLGDLELISLAKSRGLTVFTLETRAQTMSKRRPKIPDVCDAFDISCVNVKGFLRREGTAG